MSASGDKDAGGRPAAAQSAVPNPIGTDGQVKRSSKRTLLSGYSLLARGEPQIWFTGGMLVICLSMIIGLLGFILYAGLPTFWPRPVHLLVLNDGLLEIGQPQGTQAGLPDESQVAPDGMSQLPKADDNLSRYYRTGNYDLTGQHYRWLTPWELSHVGLSAPTWALVVERLEHGRLYGLLGELSIRPELTREAFAELAAVERIQLLLAQSPPEDAALLAQLTAALEQHQQQLRSQALRSGLSVDSSDLGVLQVQAAESEESASDSDSPLDSTPQWRQLSSVDDDATVLAARRLLTQPSQVLERLQVEVARATRLRRQAENLRYEISRLDARLSEYRAAVRRAEIRTETSVAQQVESAHYLLEQVAALSERQRELPQLKSILQQLASTAEWGAEGLTWFAAYEADVLPQQLADVQIQLDQWLEPIREQSPEVLSAVEEYLSGYQDIFMDKLEPQRELSELQDHLSTAEVSIFVPSAPRELELDAAALQSLATGKLTETAIDKLRELGLEVAADSLEPFETGEQLHIFSLRDAQGSKHLLALTHFGYLAGSQSDGTRALLLGDKRMACEQIVRVIPANQLGVGGKANVYLSRWREFLLENPREANTEGGLFPAIWGTIVMTLIMTIAVVPFGVMAALYLREYTKSGPLVSIIRISINNLAGVPSIVYGVFGFSFFCYTIGAYVDGGPRNAGIEPWPSGLWFAALGGLAILGTLAFFFSLLSSGPSHSQSLAKRWMSRGAMFLWLFCVAGGAILILRSPFFEGFYREYLPNPTFGKGGLLWAALTLSLLTLPVVIVATEEALSAVPNSLREGSLACGASKWQTIRRVILPHARPGILTGAILAMARGAGEVAPLMLVGALASAPDLPLDSEFPFFHGSRSFMHLGYQIYTLGFQSQNSEAAKPMVFTCTLLLILIVAVLNLTAIYLRARLKRQFQGNQF